EGRPSAFPEEQRRARVSPITGEVASSLTCRKSPVPQDKKPQSFRPSSTKSPGARWLNNGVYGAIQFRTARSTPKIVGRRRIVETEQAIRRTAPPSTRHRRSP